MTRKGTKVFALFAATWLGSLAATAQTAPKPAANSQSRLADAVRVMFDVHSFSQAVISPDGK